MHHHHRRRKKRPNYNTRTVEVSRGYNGFGFTISGQQPCILSCIVANSPADQAGLKAGDFLISVNGINVSKLPHEAVVQSIGNSFGTIRLQIAENYFSDSSEEEVSISHINRAKPRYIQHRHKMNRIKNVPSSQIKSNLWREEINKFIPAPSYNTTEENCLHTNQINITESQSQILNDSTTSDVVKKLSNNNTKSPTNSLQSPKASTSKEITNMIGITRKAVEFENVNICLPNDNTISPLEYRAVVGYMGTIEMPRQLTTSTKLQTVRSCIRKLQREKRSPSTVLMTILPNCLTLKNSNSVILASYPSSRLSYVTSSSENENRFFGLVTSAFHTHNEIEDEGAVGGVINNQIMQPQREITISNSCHVFVIDTKICDHTVHERRALEFQITCTKDPISNLCLEFPSNSEYVVNLIRSMYTMKTMPFPIRNYNLHHSQGINGGNSGKRFNHEPPANSPQPSNHSEITTTSSNSDSGIGFHNDCANISDRILVVDFPNIILNNRTIPILSRPSGICNNISGNGHSGSGKNSVQTSPEKIQLPTLLANSSQLQYKLNEFSKRVNMRPEQKVLLAASVLSEALANASIAAKNKSKLLTTKSCDDVFESIERDEPVTFQKKRQIRMSMDDISILSSSKSKVKFQSRSPKKIHEDHVFLAPGKPIRRTRKSSCPDSIENKLKSEKEQKCVLKNSDNKKKNDKNDSSTQKINVISNFINLKRKSTGGISKHSQDSFEIWGSLQDIKKSVEQDKFESHFIDGTYSEPDLIMSRALPSSTNTSPFRRWGQSSFRTVRTTPSDQRPTITRRPSSLAASENDVYTKSMDDFINDDINSVHSHSDGGEFTQIGRAKALAVNFLNAVSAQQNHAAAAALANSSNNNNNNNNFKSLTKRVELWGNSFEKLLADPAGLHTFAEFLKKEFSAENIYFWTACERYRHINDDIERAQKAVEIFSKHLGSGALEPVNVDSQARSLAEENLETADRNLFNYAQKQIYNLMKFDSYQRFIRSDLYKKCQDAEAKNQTLPYTGENLSDSLKTSIMLASPGPSKLKKSASNAEDRRRKSLLPWHRKARCKSRDRNNENIAADNNSEINPLSKSQSSSGNTLKLPHTNSISDIHSSRSSLSSFDANTCLTSSSNTAFNNASDESKKNFCRVIFSDGATTVTLTRPDQTVRQLIERLLEKRGFKYQFFDVLINPNSKSTDLESPSNILMGKEVQVEQRVAFKLDLPDPKVISVKSKPKKALCDVLKPILQKYNYRFEEVQILMRDTHEQIELSLPVTTVDGQRLEVVLLRNENLWKQQHLHKRNGLLLTAGTPTEPSTFQHQHPLGAVHKNYILTNKNNLLNGSKTLLSTGGQLNQQSTLDEITNKVFTEVLQGKVDSHENNMTKSVDLCSLRSDDCASESSSTCDRSKFRDANATNVKNSAKPKKTLTLNTAAPTTANKFVSEKVLTSNTVITQSDENLNVNNCNNSNNNVQSSNSNLTGVKKPLIAKWKTGVKLQVTARAHNQEEFLEGLKRAQRARLEDQRGTEINFELPDFLKDKANLSAANKLRKIRANLNPITTGVNNITTNINLLKSSSGDYVGIPNSNRNSLDSSTDRPQPAPRLSITKSASSIAITSNRTSFTNNNNTGHLNLSPTLKSDFQQQLLQQDTIININNNNNLSTDNLNLTNNTTFEFDDDITNDDNNSGINSVKGPPPLPPKPKILPIKPSNWGQLSTSQSSIQLSQGATNQAIIDLIPIRRTLNNDVSAAKNAYLDQPSSSFV